MRKLIAAAVPQTLDLGKCVQNALWLYDASNAVPSAPFSWMEPQIPVSTYAYIPANQCYKGVHGRTTIYFPMLLPTTH